ncbi:putative endopeptidase [Inhella inkyongensis]|uniref:Putative endopeptidase n=1 Tax=Inhella inkyongensis TaxID=392593 RepID=A0A840S6W9_9BURK|nr:M13 family metallopeptidase [Inhella inkyongensis]MBB5205258.1 putative endopeptidase [Inhella inkyongensis]
MLLRPLALAAALMSLSLAAQAQTSGLDRAGFDPAVRVQDDLFRAANGHWLNTVEMPADKSEYGAFIQLRDKSDREVRAIVEALAARTDNPKGSVAEKVALFYAAYSDLAQIDARGLAPIKPWLAGIERIQNRKDLARWLGAQQGLMNLPIALAIHPDFKEPGINRPLTWQGGLGLPNRDYYLKTEDARFAKAVKDYAVYLETLARLVGLPNPAQAAQTTLSLERRIAEVHWDSVANRDMVKIYNPTPVTALGQKAPGLDWAAFLQGAGLKGLDRLSISQPSATAGIAKLLATVPLKDWKTYLTLHSLDAQADTLPKAFRDARFAFRGTALTGASEEKPRWQQGIDQLNAAMGEALGQLYVAQHFPPEHKARMLTLVNNLLGSFGDSLEGLTWMGPQTKARARAKLASYVTKIGYPDQWRDYTALQVQAGDARGNSERASRFAWAREVAKSGKPVDKKEWGMTPQTVNAYYNPLANEIVFPAAILQPPFFDAAADDAANYGAIGAVIGHEISHGFDDQGSQFDADGALRNWWTDADRAAFTKLGEQLVAQYEQYEPVPGKKLNGKLTLGENIADLSGLQIAYKAYLKSLGGKPAPVIDGLTGQQRFFLGWSQAWREKVRESRALQLLTTDSHSPPEFRANGAAVNHDGFHEAFGTRDGDKMFKPTEKRIRIW